MSVRPVPSAAHWKPEETKIIDGIPVRFSDVCVHEITMSDIEDPDLFVADPIMRWQDTAQGKFVMQHAVEPPYWQRMNDFVNFGYRYRIMARLSEQHQTFLKLMQS